MTLKEFAQEQGVSESTARSWKHRGKIGQVSEGGPWHFYADEDPARNATGATDDCNADATQRAPLYVRSSSGVTPERVAELREAFEAKKAAAAPVTREAFEALQAEVAFLRESLAATNNALIDSNNILLALQTEVAFLRSRIANQPPVTSTHTASRGGPIDPPGPQWGA